MAHINVLVVDQQCTFAEAVAAWLQSEPGVGIVGVAHSMAAARRMLEGQRFDVMLLDPDLRGGDNLPSCSDNSGQNHPPAVIMLSASEEPERILAALRAGAVAWVRKDESIRHLLRVVCGVTRGESWVPPYELGQVFRMLFDDQNASSAYDPLAMLTAREREVLTHMADGAGRKEVAERLHLSPNTVRSHMQSLMGKLGVHSALEAVALAASSSAPSKPGAVRDLRRPGRTRGPARAG